MANIITDIYDLQGGLRIFFKLSDNLFHPCDKVRAVSGSAESLQAENVMGTKTQSAQICTAPFPAPGRNKRQYDGESDRE